ncbi:MAG: hypothetical protein RLZZ338_4792, partial [Cyanobacteriota bacterium]
ACLFGGTEVGERAPTELIGWDGVFCPNRLGGCYIKEDEGGAKTFSIGSQRKSL